MSPSWGSTASTSIGVGSRTAQRPSRRFGAGFYGIERPAPDLELNWSTAHSALALDNDDDEPVRMRVTFGYASLTPGDWTLEVRGAGVDETLPMGGDEATVTLDLLVAPGHSTLDLSTDAPADTGTDPRDLHFRVVNLDVEPIPG
jgi:hypothetical protein